jgi:cardiolipin hydrolase
MKLLLISLFAAYGITTCDAQTYFSPDQDCLTAINSFADGAQHQLLVADYSFVDPQLTEELVKLHQRGVEVRCVFDKTQAGGKAEQVQLAELKSAGVPYLIGHSEKDHIMHLKCMIRDGTDVLSGSFNFTSTAELEDNTFDIVLGNVDRTALFVTKWNKLWTFFQTQPQPK